jgi:tRNA(Ile)-lysidine synthase
MFEPGSSVVVAVSGGPDSICLLHSMVRLRRLLKIQPFCFHFDHRLRAGSDRDAAYVKRQAEQLGVEFLLRTAASTPARGESKEAWARTVRYEALFRAVEDTGSSTAAVGHTADDQAETVLLALVRGGGLDAIGGMAPVSPPVVRPLLDTTREQTVAFCRALRLRPRHDPMNEDRAYLRAAIRGEVIPLLERAVGRHVRATVVRSAGLLRSDAAFLDQLASLAADDLLAEAPDGEARLRVARLRRTPRPVSSRVARRAMLELGVVPEAAHVDAVLDLAAARPGDRHSLPGGLLAVRGREYVRLLRPSPRGGHGSPRADA